MLQLSCGSETNRDRVLMNNSNPAQLNSACVCERFIPHRYFTLLTCLSSRCQELLPLSDLKDDRREGMCEKKNNKINKDIRPHEGERQNSMVQSLPLVFCVSVAVAVYLTR